VFILFGEELAEAVEFALPCGAMVVNPLFERAKAGGLDATCADAAEFFSLDQSHLLKNLQVLHDGGERDAERLGQARNRSGTIDEPVKDGAARGIAERMEELVDIDGAMTHGTSLYPASSFCSRSMRLFQPSSIIFAPSGQSM
jgi:hypothetical protein